MVPINLYPSVMVNSIEVVVVEDHSDNEILVNNEPVILIIIIL